MDYIIHRRTQAITAIQSNYYRSKIYELNNIRYMKEPPLTIIKNSCKHYGHKLSVWNEFVKDKLNRESKLPVPISPTEGLFFVPTTSHRNEQCIWLSFYQVAHYMQNKNNLNIALCDGKTLSTNISLNQFQLQMKRTSLLIAHFYQLFYIS